MSAGHQPDLLFRQNAAECLRQNQELIFRRWETRVRKDLPAAREQDELLLRDHLQPHLDEIADLLCSPTVQWARSRSALTEQTDTSANRTHGRLRATLPGYSIDQLIREYTMMREEITDFLRERQLLDKAILEVVTTVTEKAVLRAATEFGESLQTLRQQAVSMLMHDIRNPLNVITMTAELVRHRSDTADVRKGADTILQNSHKIDTRISELLDAVRLEAGSGLELQFTRSDLKEIIHSATKGARLAYPERIKVELPKQPVPGDFDLSALSRAIENLLSNALKYGDENKDISVELTSDSQHHIISVHNWGNPIPETEQKNLFVTFSRSRDPGQNFVSEGWGLGLAYVKAAVEGHGGHVAVESSGERGTRFSMLLPRSAA